jgi:hypothetical protein
MNGIFTPEEELEVDEVEKEEEVEEGSKTAESIS